MVRVAGTGQFRPGLSEEPRRQRAQSSPACASARHAAPARSTTADFELLLDDLRADAAALAEQPLRPVPENLQGYIETLAIDTSGQVWMMGWMKRGHLTGFSAVISERRKYRQSIAIMTYLRDDLPPDACGIIGLLSSSWRPTSGTADFYMFFGGGGRFHLRAHTPLRFVTATELVEEYEGVRERVMGDGRAIALQRMLTAMESWMPAGSAGQGFRDRDLDRPRAAGPGLGCLVEGWVISPLKRWKACGCGSAARCIDRAGGSHLLEATAGPADVVSRAATAWCSAPASWRCSPARRTPEDFTDPVLKLVFQGGGSANFAIAARRCFAGWAIRPRSRKRCCFSRRCRTKRSFPGFADAAIRAQRSGMNRTGCP